MRRNLMTSLPRRTRGGCPMAAYDRLPPALRAWLAGAALPWSAASALRLWRRGLDEGGTRAALESLDRAQRRTLDRERRLSRAAAR